MRLYSEPALFESARIIGYNGVGMAEFWKKAKKLNLPQHNALMAVYDLTRADRRAEEPAMYELHADARRLCFGLLGPPPEHPLCDFILHGPGGLVGDEIGRWQEEYRRRKAEEVAEPTKKRAGRR